MSMQIIFLFVANPANQTPKSVFLSKLSYEHLANTWSFFLPGESNLINESVRPLDPLKLQHFQSIGYLNYYG